MVFGPQKTQSSNIKWIVEVYPFDSSVPQEDDFSGFSGPAVLVGNKSSADSINRIIDEMRKKGELDDDSKQPETAFGLKSLAIVRRKATPDNECNMFFVGRLPKKLYTGAWVLITSISSSSVPPSSNAKPLLEYLPSGVFGPKAIEKSKASNETKVIRFIGQISSIESSYVVNNDGLFTSNHQIAVKEWSSVLRAPVRYDIMSIQESLIASSEFARLAVAENALSSSGYSIQEIQEMVRQSFNPFELAQVVLKLIGAISKQDQFFKISESDVRLPQVAITAPFVPPGLLARMGVTDASANTFFDKFTSDVASQASLDKLDNLTSGPSSPTSPFENGFIHVVTGVQGSDNFYNSGDWNGIFGETSINDYKKTLRSNFEKIKYMRPSAMGMGVILQPGLAAWDILTQHCDPSINEIYTDLWYEEGENEFDIVAKPVVVVRDKPFLVKKLYSKVGLSQEDGWTLYDALPRFSVPAESITSFRIGNTCVNSKNYIRVDFHAPGMKDGVTEAMSKQAGKIRLEPEMRRFGGNEFFVQTQFLGNDFTHDGAYNSGNPDYQKWFDQIKKISQAWHSYNYRMGSGVLSIKDDNFPISLGFNAQFNFGSMTLVGHVETVSIDFGMDDTGLESTNMQVGLSRIMQVQIDGMLDFINLEDFGSLPWSEPSTNDSRTLINDISHFGRNTSTEFFG